MTALAEPPRVRRRTPPSGPLLAPVPARLIGFALLGAVGALAWGGMVEPARGWALLLYVAAATAAGATLARTGTLGAQARWVAAALLAAGLLTLALLAAGVAARDLLPARWDALADGIAAGLEALPNANVPYGGADDWVRVVLLLGAPLLLAIAALLACWPRRGGRRGWPVAAAAALAVLAAVPAVQLPGDAPLLEGALLAVLLVVFLGLEHVPRRAAPVAAGLAAAATLGGIAVAPALDRDEPVIDYEELAQSLTPEEGSRFAWDHRYGPMDWSRDGNVVLRVKARRGTYWKAMALTEFDGFRWVRDDTPTAAVQTEINRDRPDWIQELRVSVRGMTTEEFIGAGTTLSIAKSPRQPVVSGPGEFQVEDRPLRSGHTYEAEAYVPRPTRRVLAASGTRYPPFVADALAIRLPREAVGRPRPEVRFAAFASEDEDLGTFDGQVAVGEDVDAALRRSAYARVYALARRLRAASATPYAYVRAVERHLARGYTYSETPPERQVPLDAFLFDDRAGYCQQFSGAMALLLRMGGVPARVATGFSPGTFDRERGEYVVRDLDAHSWVEAYVPGSGWVAFDPTPSDAPASSRELGAPSPLPERDPVDPGPEQRSERDLDPEPVAGAGAQEPGAGGLPAALLAAAGAAALAGLALVGVAVRRRRARARAPVQAALDDLERALARIGRPLPPHATLGALAERFAGSAAEPYLRVLERARYAGPAAAAPGPEERAGLRRALAARGGPLGRLRAWWALPPG